MSKDGNSLAGHIVVITGASSGFGQGTALALAGVGATVVLAARRVDLLEDVAEQCRKKGGQALVVPTDVSDSKQVSELAQATIQAFGRIDVWINNAGVGVIAPFVDAPLIDHEQVIRTNLLGTLYGSYAAFSQFRRQRRGKLINIASMLGKIPAPYYVSYNASKHGVIGLTSTLRQEAKLDDDLKEVHICTVLPMAMDTSFFEHAANYTGHESVPLPPTYDAQMVVDAIVGLVFKPQDECIVGGAGVVAHIAHQLAPGLVEKITAWQADAVQMKKAKKAEYTEGAVHHPVSQGRKLHGDNN